MTRPFSRRPQARSTLRLCPNPVFVIGSPRSGTEALASSLGSHPAFWSEGETQLLFDLFGDGRLEENYERRHAADGSWLLRVGVERDEFLAFVGAGLNALLTHCSGGLRWIDKTPAYTLMVDTVADLFPGALFIHILRDGRRAVHSMMHFASHPSRKHFKTLNEPWMSDFRVASRTWKEHVEAARRFEAARPLRCLTVEHEQLLRDPEVGFAQILEYLDEPWDEAPAREFETRRVNSSFVSEPELGRRNPAQVRKLLGPNPWESWGARERAMFVEEAGRTLIQTGLATEEELAI